MAQFVLETFTPPLLDLDDPNLGPTIRAHLAANNCAAIAVFTEEEVEPLREGFLNVLRKVRPDSEGSWPENPHGSKGCGFVPSYGVAGQREVWQLRKHPKLMKAWLAYYGIELGEGETASDYLSVSVDNVFYQRPSEEEVVKKPPKKGRRTDLGLDKAILKACNTSLRPHVDLSPNNPLSDGNLANAALRAKGYPPVPQGQVPLLDSESGLVIVAGNASDFSEDSLQYQRVPLVEHSDVDHAALTGEGLVVANNAEHGFRKIRVPAGTLLLFGSKEGPVPHTNFNDPETGRLGLFHCCMPRVVPYDRAKKFDLVKKGCTGTHLPSSTKRFVSGSHMSNGAKLSKLLAPNLTEEDEEEVWRFM